MARYGPALLGILAWLLLVVAAPALAQSAPNFDNYFAAADRLDRLAAEALQRGGPPPRLSDPQVAALFPDLVEIGRVVDRPAYGTEDLPRLLDLTRRAAGIMLLYIEWGSAASDSESARARSGDRNLLLYQAEVVPMMLFVADLTSVVLRTMMRVMDASGAASLTDRQRSGLATARMGLSQMVTGLIDTMGYQGLTPERQLAIATALAANGPGFAAALTMSQRRAVIVAIRLRRDRSAGPQTRVALSRAIEAFSIAGCEGLCAI